MAENDENTAVSDAALRDWLFFWLQLLVLGAVAGFGFAFAAGDAAPGDYQVGLGVAIAAIVLGFLRLKLTLEGDARGLVELILVDDMPSLAAAVVLFIVLGAAGLVIAALWRSGIVYVAGLALFVASVLLIFCDIKRVFDRIDREPR